MRCRPVIAVSCLLALACARTPPAPAALDTRNEECAFCRMRVSDARFAAQIVAPGEEPRFFDDLGCLAAYLKKTPRLATASVAYVADHRDKSWVAAWRATYSRVPELWTPMASHLIAHRDPASRDLDAAGNNGTNVSPVELFGGAAAPERR
ncbi:MAG: nitrous oxide reductase accessory protein NosL [Deltaproteobacteria bacterium]|nr:nitrous oxide reductase accessory protein NosL [Deltaproteobacteria bacterium]